MRWGGDLFNSDLTECLLDRPENVEAIKYYCDLIKRYRVSPSPVDLETQTDLQLWMGGKMAMHFGHYCGCQFFKDIKKFTWDVAPVPKIKGKRISYGAMNRLLISKATKHPDEAWRVVKYITGKEGQRYFFEGGFDVPIRKSVGDLILTLIDYPEHRKVFIDTVSYARLIPDFPRKDELMDIISQELENIFYKDLPVEEGCKRIVKRTNEILSQQQD